MRKLCRHEGAKVICHVISAIIRGLTRAIVSRIDLSFGIKCVCKSNAPRRLECITSSLMNMFIYAEVIVHC